MDLRAHLVNKWGGNLLLKLNQRCKKVQSTKPFKVLYTVQLPNVRVPQMLAEASIFWENIYSGGFSMLRKGFPMKRFLCSLLQSWFLIMVVFFMGINKQKWVSVRGPKKKMGAARLKTTTATEARFGCWTGLENIWICVQKFQGWKENL